MADCTDNLWVISKLGSGAFSNVYKAFDKHISQFLAIKISRLKSNGLESEINIIKKLNNLGIPNISKYYYDGECSNQRFYGMDIYDCSLLNFIHPDMQHNNNLDENNLYSIVFELLYTISLFRKYNFKHRDIKLENIMLKFIDRTCAYDLVRHYELQSRLVVTITTAIKPIIIDYNSSIFEPYDSTNKLDYSDTLAILQIISELVEITNISNYTVQHFQNMIDYITQNDDLSYEFIQNVLNIYYG